MAKANTRRVRALIRRDWKKGYRENANGQTGREILRGSRPWLAAPWHVLLRISKHHSGNPADSSTVGCANAELDPVPVYAKKPARNSHEKFQALQGRNRLPR
ncbi:MAG TPA: hypothetical protein PLK99_04335, partial [Burkholderiales bacterium]|nr:hypothetical protein [Burkholderiales bacterium]